MSLVLGGTALSSLGYLLTVASAVGNGPLFAIQDGMHRRLGMPLGTTAIVVGLALVVVAAALRAPLGPGTVLIPVVTGAWISAMEPYVVEVDGTLLRWAAFLGGTAVMMLGAALAVAASVGVSALDGVMFSLARVSGRDTAAVRLGMEATMAVAGFAIGGRIGAGTLVMGATVGHLFRFWSTRLHRWGLSSPTFAVTPVAAPSVDPLDDRRVRSHTVAAPQRRRTPQSTRSMTVAFAMPPPSHMVWKPKRPPVASSWFNSVVIRRTPDAPRGWPRAMAPPRGL